MGKMDYNSMIEWLTSYGVKDNMAGYLSYVIITIGILLICIIGNLIIKKVVLKILAKIILKNKYQWDNVLLDKKVFARLANILPGIIVYLFAPLYLTGAVFIRRGAIVYILIIALLQ
jgi:miniconductance mechanosensitive channel